MGAVTKYKSRTPVRYNPTFNPTWIVGLALVGLLVWFLLKSRTQPVAGTYNNLESWEVSYNPDGLPTKITIHRDARRA